MAKIDPMFVYDTATDPRLPGWVFDMRYMLTDRDYPRRVFFRPHPRLLIDRVFIGETIRAYLRQVERDTWNPYSAPPQHNSVLTSGTGGTHNANSLHILDANDLVGDIRGWLPVCG